MAYAALVSLAQTIDLILNHPHNPASPPLKIHVTAIKEYVTFLQAFLEDFPDEASYCEREIRTAAHVAEYMIESSWSEQIHQSGYAYAPLKLSKPKFLRGKWKKQNQSGCVVHKITVESSSTSERKFIGMEKITDVIESISERKFLGMEKITDLIESISEKVMKIKHNISAKDVKLGRSSAAGSSSSRVALAPVQKDAVIGFDDDLLEMKSRLCGESSKLKVVPIVGMGGIGKSTLARNVYHDQLIMEHFQIRVWITVSQDYSIENIVSAILVSMPGSKIGSNEEHEVYKHLKGKRYIIVLDDVWSTKVWDDLKMMFPDDCNGSRIVLTTRISDVACYADSATSVHEMRLMDKHQSWNLLKRKVFKHDPCPPELECAGAMIARSCRGLPLAIALLSGLLAVEQTKDAWEKIAEDVKSAISANEEQFDKILCLSYTHLPHHLRPCFLYMGCFPEDYDMHVSRLIRLWVAEGFLKPKESKSLEETGEEYLDDLVRRSLVLVTSRRSDGGIKTLSIHDLMRNMCIRIAQEEDFSLHVDKFLRGGIRIPRRLSVASSGLTILENISCSSVRTVVHLERWRGGRGCSLGHFRLLRILDLSNAYEFFFYSYRDIRHSLPVEVFELFHLRYLALDSPFPIPAAVSNLQNLQTLIICSSKLDKYFAYEVSLPLEIWMMPQLRHLVSCFHLLPIEEEAEFALENLQTLSTARNFILSRRILRRIQNLKKLGVHYTADDGEEDYQLHNLVHLQHLEKLKLMISVDFLFRDRIKPAFPTTLKKLSLSGLGLPWKDIKAVGRLPYLEVLKLRDYACDRGAWETSEGEFSQLKFLLISRSYLAHWITESSHFPRLERLVLRRCIYLDKIPDEIGEIPTLKLIEVDNWNRGLVDSAKQIQDEQQSNGNDAFQVHRLH